MKKPVTTLGNGSKENEIIEEEGENEEYVNITTLFHISSVIINIFCMI
jgi:hypothetical protein